MLTDKTVLALDIGSTTGFAVNVDRANDAAWHGTVKFSAPIHDQRFCQFADWLADRITDLKPDIIVYEHGTPIGLAAKQLLFGFAAVARLIAWRREVAVLFMWPSTLKKWATGKGNCTKSDMINEAEKRGFAPKTDHEADAILLLLRTLEVAEVEAA